MSVILVADDEQRIVHLVRDYLQAAGYQVLTAYDGATALAQFRHERPDLVVLDLNMPGGQGRAMDGLDVTRAIRRESETPIIMLTARVEETDRIIGLELGADDYVTKPFSPRVLLARVKAVLRRHQQPEALHGEAVRVDALEIDPARYEVRVDGEPVQLTATQFAMLNFLAQRPGWVFTRNQIINAVKGDDYPVTERSVDVQIVGLRKKLGSAGALIETIRGVGYRFKG